MVHCYLGNFVVVNGGWSQWSDWEGCIDCMQHRTRTCTNPPRLGGGIPCSGPDTEENRCCSGR